MRETDLADRRSFVVLLTPDGLAAAQRAAAAIADLEQQALAAMSPVQRAGFYAVIDALTEVSR